MTLEQIKSLLNDCNNGAMDRTYKTRQGGFYANELIRVVAIDSSNNWINKNDMTKMWSIIFEMKKDIRFLQRYKELNKNLNIKITPVKRGQNKGCYGIRIYHLKQEPRASVVKAILDFIFS